MLHPANTFSLSLVVDNIYYDFDYYDNIKIVTWLES